MRLFFLLASLMVLSGHSLSAQQASTYTQDDTLRGSITPERGWWDLTFYDLHVRLDVEQKRISGHNTVWYKVLHPDQQHLQIDLQPPLTLERAEQDGKPLVINQVGKNAYWLVLDKVQQQGNNESVTIWYSGVPKEAVQAPWDGGFSWSKDKQGRPFIATSCQGLGASVWWPCKDHPYDEPDSQRISITVPEPLMDVSNGRLRQVNRNPDGTQTFEWFVTNPLNNYGVNLNVAEYAHFADTFHGEKGVLDLDYYVLQENLDKARQHFKQVKGMLKAFEHWFGPYPFYEDGYKLVEVPYLGMEHQSSVTYGNWYLNGYRGKDLSGTGWGLKWDFIIIHESGHEWFANNITYRDNADMWIHESFTNYSESLYTEFHFGKQAGAEYVRGCRKLIENQKPIIPPYGVNADGPLDMYYKGGNFLHTLRQIADNDVLWRDVLRGLNRDFYHQTVSSAQVEAYISKALNRDLSKVFEQYLRHADVPVLEYRMMRKKVEYRWMNCVQGFNMPVKVALSPGKYRFIYPGTEWKRSRHKLHKISDLEMDPDFYVESRKL